MKCEYLTVRSKSKPTLFSKRAGYAVTEAWTRPDSIPHYTVTHEAMQRVAQFIMNTRQNHDVIPASLDIEGAGRPSNRTAAV